MVLYNGRRTHADPYSLSPLSFSPSSMRQTPLRTDVAIPRVKRTPMDTARVPGGKSYPKTPQHMSAPTSMSTARRSAEVGEELHGAGELRRRRTTHADDITDEECQDVDVVHHEDGGHAVDERDVRHLDGDEAQEHGGELPAPFMLM